MGKAIPTQHPAVVLRSHFRAMRTLLAAALIAVVGLSAAVVILAGDDPVAGTSSAEPIGSIEYGGFNPATGRPDSAPNPHQARVAQPPSTRYDGGPEEGTRDPLVSPRASSLPYPLVSPRASSLPAYPTPEAIAPGARYDGGPEEGTRGLER